MKELLIVGLGGFIGSSSRYAVYLVSNHHFPNKPYLGTLFVNLIGCFVIGLISGSIVKSNSQLGLFLMTGLCGGFTTFSSFALDGYKLLKAEMYQSFFTYTLISLIGGLLVCVVGFMITNRP